MLKIDYPSDGSISIWGMDSLDIHHTLMCGQAFRWQKIEENYMGVVKGHALRVRQEGELLKAWGCPENGLEPLIIDYFDLEKKYVPIEEAIAAMDPYLAEAVAFGRGLRLLRQDPWECLISFIISARNNIPSIRRTIEAISGKYGDKIEFEGELYYAFPSPGQLASADIDGLNQCGAAFRSKYILDTAIKVFKSGIDFDELRHKETMEGRSILMEFKGVGEKVADCILLFALQKYDAFPIDVWINRVMKTLYFNGEDMSMKKMREYACARFREYAGYAQEYLYYWARALPKERWSIS
jgi:N-glycosylase/DNA lyase